MKTQTSTRAGMDVSNSTGQNTDYRVASGGGGVG
jgi:hypothetical protein